MADYKQANRQMVVSTPLGQDKLLLVGFEGTEQISGLYSFRLDLVAKNSDSADVKFDKLLGQELAVTMWIQNKDPNSTEPEERYFRGICRQFSQGNRDQEFTYYRAEIVPQFWLTTRTAQSRIFQQISVPDILKKVLTGLKVSYKLEGNFEKREYCVQYRETDFNFVSRLMEEEGIFYFFKHDKGGHELVIANSAPAHEDVPGAAKVQWNVEEGDRTAMRHIHEWVKLQDIRSGKFALWDQSFQRPGDNFESKKNTLGSIAVGKVTHKLEVAGNEKFEIYDYPGEFAQRFDGIDKGGGEQGGELGKISQDGSRTVGLRMQAETLAGLVIQGSSNCNQFTSGHKFTLEKHFDAEGSYVLTSVHHMAQGGTAYRSGADDTFVYSNSFTCIPKDLPYRPQRTTPKPCVMGVQTAVVVGPAGDEIFTDKYGRVKVQFPWDRQGKYDADSACWLRVGTPWAGKQWGAIHIPRIGHEVIVQFLEGDPDAPIIVGSVYNAGAMPPYALPGNKTQSGIKSRSSMGGSPDNFNEIRFEDKKGDEMLSIQAEKDREMLVKHDNVENIGHDEVMTIGHDQTETVKNNRTVRVDVNHTETIGANMMINVGSSLTEMVAVNYAETVGAAMELTVGAALAVTVGAIMTETVGGAKIESVGAAKSENVGGVRSLNVGGDKNETIAKHRNVTVAKDQKTTIGGQQKISVTKESILNAKKVQIIAEDEILLKTGSASITLKKNGDIVINGKKIEIKGSGDVVVKGSQIKEN